MLVAETIAVEANGLRFSCLSEGSGKLALLLHGFPDTARTWDDVLPRIAAKGYRAVAPYLRGYHPTALPPRDSDGTTLAHDVLALISALGEERAVVVGHDWGALASYGAASLAPEKIEKLFIVGIPHPTTMKPTWKKLHGARHIFAFQFPGAEKRFAKNNFAGVPELYHRWSPKWKFTEEDCADVRRCFSQPGSLHAALGYYRALDFRTPKFLLEKIKVPAVVFAGLDDPILDPADYHHAKKMFAADYIVEELAGGHFLHRESPDDFSTRLLRHFP